MSAEPVPPKAAVCADGRPKRASERLGTEACHARAEPGIPPEPVNENPDHVRPAYCWSASRKEDTPASGRRREVENAKGRQQTARLLPTERGPRRGSAPGPMRFSISVTTGISAALRALSAVLCRGSVLLIYNRIPVAPCEAL